MNCPDLWTLPATALVCLVTGWILRGYHEWQLRGGKEQMK